MLNSLFIFLVAGFLVFKGSTLATKYAIRLAEHFHLSKYVVGFIIIAVISILPETFIAINAAVKEIPSFGLGMLFGSNIVDLTVIFAIIIFVAGRSLKIESKILKTHAVYPFLLLLPLVLGLDGRFSRFEGLALIIVGIIFYYLAFKNGTESPLPVPDGDGKYKSLCMLLLSMGMLLLGAHFTVTSATSLAHFLSVSPILIGMVIVGVGTAMPELFFSLTAVKKRDDSLAVGDILGTVLADATIVIGILAVINPFFFPKKIIYITGVFMVAAAFMLFNFMRSGRTLTKREAVALFLFWLVFVLVEFIANS